VRCGLGKNKIAAAACAKVTEATLFLDLLNRFVLNEMALLIVKG
jgi:hypothetical protein